MKNIPLTVKIILDNGETFTETSTTEKNTKDYLREVIMTYELRYPENEIVSAVIQEG